LTAVVSKSGKVDAGIWRYKREWVRDNAMTARGLLQAGQPHRARIVLERLLRDFVQPDGSTVDSGKVREEAEFDQNGILLQAVHQYYAWTGDLGWIKSYWPAIRSLADFPLKQKFKHRPSGMLANQREFWKRHCFHGIQRGMELAYQVFVSMGLEAAAELAEYIGDKKSSRRWRSEACRLKHAALEDVRFSLVHQGYLIKRRGIRGAVQDDIHMTQNEKIPQGGPLSRPGRHELNPDSSSALPIAMHFISPDSPLAQRTLDELEKLWNQDWTGGGYGRYHVHSEPDSPGPRPFASLFIARANLEAGHEQAAWKVLRWLNSLPGAKAGTWFEFYGPRPSPLFPQAGIPPWIWSEMLHFIVHHMLGIRPGVETVAIQPRLLPGIKEIQANLPLRKRRLTLNVVHSGDKAKVISNTGYEMMDGRRAVFQYGEEDIRIKIILPE
jgi:GH15 family glucan-1,4-alpha-glucosidase